jgi:molybdopterin/thiamine biosynthesis adenylyltransferase
MSAPFHYAILASQLERLRSEARRRRLRLVEGVAFVADGESFHLFIEKPAFSCAGAPLPCFFLFAGEADLTDCLVEKLEAMGARPESPVLVVPPSGAQDLFAFPAAQPRERFPVSVLSPEKDLASRGGAILEGGVLRAKKVLVVGLGSFGSVAAVELAKTGVGHFILADNDRLEPGNLCRHACGIADVGRRKTLAVRDLVLARNPDAEVETFENDVNAEGAWLRKAARECDLALCMTDTARSRFNVNAACVGAGKSAIYARAVTRAEGGDVFRYRPGGPCLACLFSGGGVPGAPEVSSARDAAEAAADYAPPGYAESLVQPGLANDIAPLVQMAVKLALAELAPKDQPLWKKLGEDLEAPFYVWANRREGLYAEYPPLGYSFNKSAILRWYGVRVARDKECLACGLG